MMMFLIANVNTVTGKKVIIISLLKLAMIKGTVHILVIIRIKYTLTVFTGIKANYELITVFVLYSTRESILLMKMILFQSLTHQKMDSMSLPNIKMESF